MASPTPFQGKVIAITGAGSGMGYTLAHYLALRGATLSLADLNAASLEAAKTSVLNQSPDTKISITALDVRDANAVDAWIADTVSTHGKLDGCANLAGIAGKGVGSTRLHETTDDEWDLLISINLTGVFNCMRAQLNSIVKGGSIVNASSIAGIQGLYGAAAYAAAKHGVVGLTRTAAKENGDREIRVNCFCPGPIDTPMTRSAAETQDQSIFPMALKRHGTAEEAAALIAYFLGEESRFTTGCAWAIDGGWAC